MASSSSTTVVPAGDAANASPDHPFVSACFQLTLVRHGETEENRVHIIQGQADTLLNDTGKQQARLVGQRLANENFSEIYSSDLKRAKNTADSIVCQLQGQRTIITDPRLRERSFGSCEGCSYSDLIQAAHAAKAPVSIFTPQGGETWEQMSRRAREFMKDLFRYPFSNPPTDLVDLRSKPTLLSQYVDKNENSGTVMHLPTAHILVVSHGGFIKSLLDNLKNQCRCVLNHRPMVSPNTGVTSLLLTVRQEKTEEKQNKTSDETNNPIIKCVSITSLCVYDAGHLHHK